MAELLHLTTSGVETEPVIFLHGVACSGRLFSLRCTALAERHNLLFPDLLGFGFSPRPKASLYDPQAHVEALHQTLLARAPAQLAEGLTFVTHSLGGLIALAYATRYPQYVKRLVFFNPIFYWSPEQARSQLIQGSTMARFILGYPRVAQSACLSLCSTGVLGHVGPYLLRNLPKDVIADAARHSWASLSRTMFNTIINYDLENYLSELKVLGVPSSFIIGQYDKLSFAGQAERLEAALPTASIQRLPMGHQPFYFRADYCVELLQAELNKKL